ncbi:hypothetical protein [Paracoccus sulfuroxidans]|uniref:Uncharacterized protein n=1 Tax=Paracoccus sulfuroxidans TaxID=384678 RepID=A0A562NCY7_9RHOB|nr:hypothetical protein [Paracoccus sulfuroxidans]TWI29918.1 hypothetical protein IQ24_03390 [Paracoccus sulfuroxidans]
MTKLAFAVIAALLVAGCGVDGAPIRPQAKTEPGLSVSGEARIGVVTSL